MEPVQTQQAQATGSGESFIHGTACARPSVATQAGTPKSRILRSVKGTSSDAAVIPLPPFGILGDPPFWTVVRKRHSGRKYGAQPLRLAQLGALVWACAGVTPRGDTATKFRTVPSAGALHPTDLYVAVQSVTGLNQGVYRYVPSLHSMQPVMLGSCLAELSAACLGQAMIRYAAVCLAWVGSPARCIGKYGDRAFRYMMLDAGHSAQNAYLACTALGFQCCEVGAFYDQELAELLGVRAPDFPMIIMPVGLPRG